MYIIIPVVTSDMKDRSKMDLCEEIERLQKRVDELEFPRTKGRPSSGKSGDTYEFIYSPTVNLVMGIDGTITEISKLSAEQLGYTEEEMVGNNLMEFVVPDHRERVYKQLMRDFKGDYIPGIEIDIVAKDGSTHTLLFSPGQEVLYDGYRPSSINFTGIDITDRKLAEEELKRYSERLEEEVRERTSELIQAEKMAAVGQLVAGVAHEINNPLAFIKSKTERIIEDVYREFNSIGDPDLKRFMRRILEDNKKNLEGMKRIATITQNLKMFARPDSENKSLSDVNEGLGYTLVMMQNQFKHNIKIHEEYGKIPKLKCNIGQLNQVFMNLLLNASESMDKGDIWVKTWNDEQNIYIEIKDNGKGIPGERVGKIFDPFFTTKDNGTGLGLSISYRLIRDHGGNIMVDSEGGKGTAMNIWLPRRKIRANKK